MHDELWAGAELKSEHAAFYLEKMGAALLPPERTAINVAIESSGAILDTRWQDSFYAYLDAFLIMSRSVPEVISTCFGFDATGSPRHVRTWFARLDSTEQDRRRRFSAEFEDAGYGNFRKSDLSNARNITVHRSGVPPVEVKITGRFGVTYTGTPVERVPVSETRQVGSEFQWLVRPVALRPGWQDFEINGKPLFAECKDYLRAAQLLLQEGRTISMRVHGDHPLTAPPP